MHTGKQKQMNASYQASLVNRHIRRFTGNNLLLSKLNLSMPIRIYVVERSIGWNSWNKRPYWQKRHKCSSQLSPQYTNIGAVLFN